MAMNYVRFKSVLGNMTAVAQRVYAAVPTQGAWSHDQIAREIKRQGGSTEYRVMQGCLNALKGAGLITESPAGGHFVRAEVRGKPNKPLVQQEKEATMAAPASTPEPKATKTPLDALAEIAALVRSIGTQCEQLAADIDATAVAAMDYIEHSDKDTEKLRQLQTLLKSLA